MSDFREQLIQQLEALPNITLGYWKDSDLLCVYNTEREIAHFQNETEIDIRLTPKLIKQLGLTVPADSTSHPDRSPRSRWIIQPYKTAAERENIVSLIQQAAAL